MGLTDKLADKAMDSAKERLDRATTKVKNESATARLRTLREMRDDQPITIESLLVLFVDAIHDDVRRDLSKRDVKKAGKGRQRWIGGAGRFGGGAGTYLADLYCEAEIFCDVADHHKLTISDEDLAAHLLVMWNAMPDLVAARAAIEGSGQSVAQRMSSRLREQISSKPVDEMTKVDAIMALWRLRAMAQGVVLPPAATARDVAFPGKRVKAVIKASERQLGVASPGLRIPFRRRPADEMGQGRDAAP